MSASIGHSAAGFGLEPLPIAMGDGDTGFSQEQQWDSVETYFECITTCSLDDGECITECVERLREHH
jgi:hypothetical protein